MPTLFISYPREYRGVVERLVGHLRSSGYDPYFDEQLAGGQSWWDELLTRIESADVFVPMIGTQYLQSTPCHLEAQYATNWNKRILPVMIEPVPSQLFMPSIATAHWVDYTPNRENAILDVIRAINLLPPPSPAPSPPPDRPAAPISYMTELQNEVMGSTEITRERQLVLIADLKGRLGTGDRDAAVMLLANLRNRPDLYYQSATDIDELLTWVGVRPGAGNSRAGGAGSAAPNAFDLSSVETVVVPGGTMGQLAAASRPAPAQPGTGPMPSNGAAGSPVAAGAQRPAVPTPGYPATAAPRYPTSAAQGYLAGAAQGYPTSPAAPAAWPGAPAPSGTAPPLPATGASRPNSFIPLAIVATVLFIPLGVVALIMASRSNTAWDAGDAAAAMAASKRAKGWAIAGIVAGAIVIMYLIGTNGFSSAS